MHENENEPKLVLFCPVEEEVVQVEDACLDCRYWDGDECLALRLPLRRPRWRRSGLPRAVRAPRLLRAGGRGVRVPPVWERWPRGDAARDEPVPHPQEAEPGFEDVDAGEDEEMLAVEPAPEPWEVEPIEGEASLPADVAEPSEPTAAEGHPAGLPDLHGPFVPQPDPAMPHEAGPDTPQGIGEPDEPGRR